MRKMLFSLFFLIFFFSFACGVNLVNNEGDLVNLPESSFVLPSISFDLPSVSIETYRNVNHVKKNFFYWEDGSKKRRCEFHNELILEENLNLNKTDLVGFGYVLSNKSKGTLGSRLVFENDFDYTKIDPFKINFMYKDYVVLNITSNSITLSNLYSTSDFNVSKNSFFEFNGSLFNIENFNRSGIFLYLDNKNFFL